MEFYWLIVVISLLGCIQAAKCPADGLWPESEGGIDIVVNCPNGTYGRMSRYCMKARNNTAEWQEAKMDSCLELKPEPGMAYIDMIYNIPQSRARFIEYRPSGFNDALQFVYRINTTAVTVHRIAEEANMTSSVQVRITLEVEKARELYDEIMKSEHAAEIAEYFQKNNNNGRRYQYLTLKGNLDCDITYLGNRLLTVTLLPPKNAFVEYMKDHLLWIILCCVEFVVMLILALSKGRKQSNKQEKQPLV